MNPKYGYNNTLGGEHGLPSEHSKHKMSEAKKGKYNGENNPMYVNILLRNIGEN